MASASFPRAHHGYNDFDSVRRKLCESLTSALEMVVSKQVVKSVLGVVKDVDGAAQVENVLLEAQFMTKDAVLLDGNIESEALGRVFRDDYRRISTVSKGRESLTMDMDVRLGIESKSNVNVDEMQIHSGGLSAANHSEKYGLRGEFSRLKKLKLERHEIVSKDHETTGGLQLMEQARRVACSVEFNLHSLNGGVNKKYKEKARSLLFNLKDKSNPELRVRVFTGEITPDILVRMSAEQLASKKLSQWRTAKAEEFASMVVLTDADVVPCKIVKKTHKGEFPVIVEETDLSGPSEKFAFRPSDVMTARKDGRDATGCHIFSGTVGKDTLTSKVFKTALAEEDGLGCRRMSCLGSIKTAESDMLLSKVERCAEGLPSVTSRYKFSNYRDDVKEIPEETRFRECPSDLIDLVVVDLPRSAEISSDIKLSTIPEVFTVEGSKRAKTEIEDSGGFERSIPSTSWETDCGIAIWEGKILLSATRYVPVDCFYKSGEKLELRDWPRSVEIKGRVRLLALDKFLHDLQLSRSRTVTVISLCPSVSQGNIKQNALYLKEMADQFCIGDRAGFVEPTPGFELYLLAPGSACSKVLREDIGSIKVTISRENEVLVGVIVWRKCQHQG